MSVAKGWKKQKSVLVALFLRELKARFTSGQGGLFWTFFQPFFMVVIFLLMHLFMRGSSADAESAKHEAIFLTVGFVPFFLFRNLLNGSAGAFRANRNLFVYRHVKPIDTIIARVIVETFIYSIIIAIFIVVGLYFGVDIVPKNLVMVTIAYIWFLLFGTAWGILVAVGSTFYDSIGKVVGFLTFPLLFLSALFYSIESVYRKSPEVATMLLYNPLVHFMEMIHGNYLYDYDDRYVDYSYMALWTLPTLFVAIWLYILLERKIISAT